MSTPRRKTTKPRKATKAKTSTGSRKTTRHDVIRPKRRSPRKATRGRKRHHKTGGGILQRSLDKFKDWQNPHRNFAELPGDEVVSTHSAHSMRDKYGKMVGWWNRNYNAIMESDLTNDAKSLLKRQLTKMALQGKANAQKQYSRYYGPSHSEWKTQGGNRARNVPGSRMRF